MPQLNLLREPSDSVLALEVWMPASPHRRWCLSWAALDNTGRPNSSGALTVPRSAEHQDLGFWLKDMFDHWFNGDPTTLGPAAERSLRGI